MKLAADDLAAITRLSMVYASSADGGDPEGYVSVFAPDAVLEVWRPERRDAPSGVRRGRDDLAGVPLALARYDSTDHRVLDVVVTPAGDGRATGVVSCEAHHVDGDRDIVMTVQYRDRYRRDHDGVWRIEHRVVDIQAIDELMAG